MARREALSKWLEFAAKKRIKQEVDQTDFQVKDFVYICLLSTRIFPGVLKTRCRKPQLRDVY